MNHHNPTPPHAADQPPHGANNAENTSTNNGTNNNANTTGSAESASFAIPAPLKRLLTHLPAWPGSVLFVSALNLILAPQIPSDVAQALQERRLRIHVRDAQIIFDFSWLGKAFAACPPTLAAPDVTISASAADFVALARREQDPDTLFFSRRLLIEGNTELGLMVKNMLDALELPVSDLRQMPLPAPRALLCSLMAALRPAPAAQTSANTTFPK